MPCRTFDNFRKQVTGQKCRKTFDQIYRRATRSSLEDPTASDGGGGAPGDPRRPRYSHSRFSHLLLNAPLSATILQIGSQKPLGS